MRIGSSFLFAWKTNFEWIFFCSPALTAALRDLATQIPQLKKDIQDGLLKILSIVLIGRPLKHPGAPKSPLSPLPVGGIFQ